MAIIERTWDLSIPSLFPLKLKFPPAPVNPNYRYKVDNTPNQQQVALRCVIHAHSPQGRCTRQQHQRVLRQRGVAVPPAHLHQPLVIMAAMRLRKLFATDCTLEQRDGCIGYERRKNQQREPERPISCLPAPRTECRGKKPQRYRARIPHEYSGGVKIEKQKT